MKTILTMASFLGLMACDQVTVENQTGFIESDSDTVDSVMNTNAQEEANRLIVIARAAERWFEKNTIQPRVHDYDTAYELPMSEIKAADELPMNYALPPGGMSGTDENSVLGGGYTVRVVKVDEAGVDKFNITATLGDKAQPLPLTPPSNCYVYGTTRQDGTITSWNWHMMPSTAALPLPYVNTNCTALSGSLSSIAGSIRGGWSSYSPPNPVRPDTITCQVIGSIPATAPQPSGQYEDVIHCNFDYVTPPQPTYCNGSLLITMQSAPINSQSIGTLSHDCVASDTFIFRGNAINRIATLGLDTTSPVCNVINSHLVRCTATENPSGGGGGGTGTADECDVFVYNDNGTLPSVATFHWDDTDCTGMNTATQTILEFLQFDEYLNNVFALDAGGNVDTSRVNSNKFCDFHFDNSGSLGSLFDNELYYNCDNSSKLSQFVTDYNFSNPTNQLIGCDEYNGSLNPDEVKHKASCEQDSNSYNTNLPSRNERSEYSCLLVGNNCRIGDGVMEINISSLSSISNQASIQTFHGDEGHSGGGTFYDNWRPWVTVSDGSINDIITAGYTYSINLVFSGQDSNGTINPSCSSSHTGTINLNSTNIALSMSLSGDDNDASDASCRWSGTIFEYKNGTATGAQSNINFSISAEQTW